MSTRSATRIFVAEFKNAPPRKLVDLYRHCDGYPQGAGVDLAGVIDRATRSIGFKPYKTRVPTNWLGSCWLLVTTKSRPTLITTETWSTSTPSLIACTTQTAVTTQGVAPSRPS